jgi:predicted ATPase
VRADFRLDDRTLAATAGICRQLDGLPLAIELAAARAHTMDPADIAGALDHRFELLTAGRRTLGRHRSLRAAVSWSYDLLEPDERAAFERLSVFAGSFTIEAAAAVAELPPALAPELLAGLAERSLITRRPGGGRTRYALLETLRAFGGERLTDAQRLEARRRHGCHYLDLVEQLAPRVGPPGDPGALGAIDAEVAELRVAHQFFLEQGDADAALRLVVALHWYGLLRMRPEVLEWAERSVDLAKGSDHLLLPEALGSAALAAWKRGDHERCADFARRGVAAAPFPDHPSTRRAWSARGASSMTNGHLDEADEYQARALAAAERSGDRELLIVARMMQVLNGAYAGRADAVPMALAMVGAIEADERSVSAAWIHYAAGEALLMAGEPSRAQPHLELATTIAEAYGAPFIMGVSGASLASIEARQGDPDVAARRFVRLLEHWRRSGEWSVLWTMIRSVSELLVRLGADREAAVLSGAVLASRTAAEAYGDDARRLEELTAELRQRLGARAFDQARAEGAAQSDDATVLFAEAALSRAATGGASHRGALGA